ncbi:MAG TPA: FliA/WhiG family RNA polymerase sigma factor [Firmicutes bacterium]|nr:FliA/WhiG family RNA polymerase sigma factor [Bacillota bacterium]
MSVEERQLQSLWNQFKKTGDPKARESLVTAYLHLVKYIAGRMAVGLPNTVEYEDLVSYGIFGLLDAIEKYDTSRGVRFESYASTRIRGAILDGLRSVDWVPRSVRLKARQLAQNMAELEDKLGRPPTDEELQNAMGITADEYAKLLQETAATTLLSLDEPWSEGGHDGEKLRLTDMVADTGREDPAALVARESLLEMLTEAIEALPERERLVITLYYYEELTLKEIGKVLDVSESRVSQLHTKALSRLRGKLARLGVEMVG